MIKIDPYWLEDLFLPFAGDGDDDRIVRQYEEFDSENPVHVGRLTREHIVPEFKRFKPKIQEKIKRTLMYCLSETAKDLKNEDRYFYQIPGSMLPAFDWDNPRDFFLIIWQELFPGEDWHLPNMENYEVDWTPHLHHRCHRLD